VNVRAGWVRAVVPKEELLALVEAVEAAHDAVICESVAVVSHAENEEIYRRAKRLRAALARFAFGKES
jgi:hypothetical protein